MSLTQDDLRAIQNIVQTTVETAIQTTVQPMIDVAVDSLAQSAAAGFAEVHEKLTEHDQHFEQIESRLDRIENKLDVTIDQVDDHEVRLKQLVAKPA